MLGIKKNCLFVCPNPTDPRKTCWLFFFFQFLKKKKKNLLTDLLFFSTSAVFFLVFFFPIKDLRNMENMGKHEYMESMNIKTWMFISIWKKEGFHTHGPKKKKKRTDLDFFLTLRQTKTYFFFYALVVHKCKLQVFVVTVYLIPE